MEGVNFLEACEALRDGKCREIENEIGDRYYNKGGITLFPAENGGVFLSPKMFLGKWKLIGVKKKVVIEDVGWRIAVGLVVPFQGSQDPMKLFGWKDLVGHPKMKMTLEWEE